MPPVAASPLAAVETLLLPATTRAGVAHLKSGSASSSGETHFTLDIVSAKFEGLTSIKRHRHAASQPASLPAARGGWRRA